MNPQQQPLGSNPSQHHHSFVGGAPTTSFTNYSSQLMRNMNNNTPSPYQYHSSNNSEPSAMNAQFSQHFNNQGTNNVYSNNNNSSTNLNIQPSSGIDYNLQSLKSHNISGLHSNNNNSFFQNAQYNNFGQPQQQPIHSYHRFGGTNFQSPHPMNSSSSSLVHSSQDMTFKQQETFIKPPTNSQSPDQIINNYYATTNSQKSPLNNSPSKQPSLVNQQKTVDSSISYQTPSSTFTPTERSKNKSPSKTPTNSTESNEDSASEEESTNSPNARRAKKSTRACEACRKHHRKCDGGNPCQTCSGKGVSCVYTERKKRGPKNEATKLLKREIQELKEKLNTSEKIKSEWEQKCKELAKMAGISITLNEENMPVFNNFPQNQNNTTFPEEQTMIIDNNSNHVFSTTFNNMPDGTLNPLSNIPTFSISASTEESINKKRKQVEEEYNENLKKQKVSSNSSEIENLDLTQARTVPMDGQRFALSTMVTRFITIWDNYVHPFHSLLPAKWQSAMPDLLYDIIRNDGVNSENTLFMYSLLCNSARSLGDIMLSRELHHKAVSLYPLHTNNPDPRVGFSLVLLSYYSMSVGALRKAIGFCKESLRISELLERPQLNLQMNAYLSIANISDDYEERRVNFKRLGQTKQICDVIMSVTGEIQNEITHGGNTNYKELIAQMADLLRLKNMSSANVTLMHEVAIYGILILCLHKAGYRDLGLNYGRKLLEISKDANFKHCCIGTTSTAIAQAASMFLEFEGYPEFYECMSIMDELSMRYELAGLMKKNVEERFVLMSNYLSSGGSSNGSSHNSPNMVQFL